VDEHKLISTQTCGGVGHISRDCPSSGGGGGRGGFGGGAGAGGFGGARKCYVSAAMGRDGGKSDPSQTRADAAQNCGQEGHISRECPQDQGRTVSRPLSDN
jgi:cellular nucleic acid-binding protein